MAKPVEQRIQELIGQMAVQIVGLQTENEQLKEKLAEKEQPKKVTKE